MRFSVIIPVYNAASTISKSIDSVLKQKNQDFELLVVDDGSTDALGDALEPYRDQIQLLQQENQGVSAARNYGIAQAKGDYICFLDADDIWYPNHLEVLTGLIDEYPNKVFFSTMPLEIAPDGTLRTKEEAIKGFSDPFVCSDFIGLVVEKSNILVNTNSVCIRRDILERIKFRSGEKIGEDVDLWYRIAAYHDVVFSKQITNVYNRVQSTATKGGLHNFHWCFGKSARHLLKDPRVTPERKISIAKMVDSWLCTSCRIALYEGRRKEARYYLSQVTYRDNYRYLFSAAMCLMPDFLLQKLSRTIDAWNYENE